MNSINSIIFMICDEIGKFRINSSGQSSIRFTKSGFGSRSGDQTLDIPVWSVHYSSLSICSTSQTKWETCCHSGIERSFYGKVSAQPNKSDKKFFSVQMYFYQWISQSGTGRLPKTQKKWPRERTAKRLILDSNLIGWVVRSYLWFIAFWSQFWMKQRIIQLFK